MQKLPLAQRERAGVRGNFNYGYASEKYEKEKEIYCRYKKYGCKYR